MNLVISGDGVAVTPAMHTHAMTKVMGLVRRFNGIHAVEVLYRVTRERSTDSPQEAQILIKLPDRKQISLSQAAPNAYRAMSLLAQKAAVAVADLKKKNKQVRRRMAH